MRLRVLELAVGSALLWLAAFPAAALADSIIPAGRSVVDISTVGQDVTLNGTSQGSVIIIDGDLTIGPHGRALNGVTLIGGHLTIQRGGSVHGDLLQVGGSIPHPNGWTIAGILVAALLVRTAFVWLIYRVGAMLADWPTTTAILTAARTRPLRTTLVGALLTAGVLAAAVMLTLTAVGIVFAAALGGVLLLAVALGVGFALAAARTQAHRRTVGIALVFPIVGDALLAVAAVVGLGAVFHYLVDERRSPTVATTQT